VVLECTQKLNRVDFYSSVICASAMCDINYKKQIKNEQGDYSDTDPNYDRLDLHPFVGVCGIVAIVVRKFPKILEKVKVHQKLTP
jgi:hypothetical protein